MLQAPARLVETLLSNSSAQSAYFYPTLATEGGEKKILEHLDVVHDGGISVGTFGNHQAIPEGNPVEIPAHEALTLLTAIIQRPPSTMYSRA
jgi:hypothetical protein